MEEIQRKILQKKTLVDSYTTRPPVGQVQVDEQAQHIKDLAELKAQLADLVMSERDASSTASAVTGASDYLETNLLVSGLGTLGKFNGGAQSETAQYISRIRAIRASCPSIPFPTFLAAIRPKMSVSVNKTIDNAKITNMDELAKVLNTNYGLVQNCFQLMENWWTKPKKSALGFTEYHCELQNQLEPIIASYEKNIKTILAKNDSKREPSFRDAFGIMLITKMLQSIRSDSSDLYNSIIIELNNFDNSEQLSARAEVLSSQTGYKSSNAADNGADTNKNKKQNEKPAASQSYYRQHRGHPANYRGGHNRGAPYRGAPRGHHSGNFYRGQPRRANFYPRAQSRGASRGGHNGQGYRGGHNHGNNGYNSNHGNGYNNHGNAHYTQNDYDSRTYGVNAAFEESYVPLPFSEPEQITTQPEEFTQTDECEQLDYSQQQSESYLAAYQQPDAHDSAYYSDLSYTQYDPSYAAYDTQLASHTEAAEKPSKN